MPASPVVSTTRVSLLLLRPRADEAEFEIAIGAGPEIEEGEEEE